MNTFIGALRIYLSIATAENRQPPYFKYSGDTHGLIWGFDPEQGERYVLVGYNLPPGVYAEIEDGTYGELQGIRVYVGE